MPPVWRCALIAISALLLLLPPPASPQFVASPRYTSQITSPINPDISVSYKSPDPGTCKTVFPTQKQYTGYVTLPPFTLAPIQQDYSINTFFWFVEAREKARDAPLTIWLNGGPGSSSMFGFFEETGPCEVVTLPDGAYGTQARTWGWDRMSNMLFIDQPAQVGFSYDTLVNGSMDLLRGGQVLYPPRDLPDGQPAYTFLDGTFGSGNSAATANTTEIAATATWHFLQAWLSSFPQYDPGRSSASDEQRAAGVHLFAESYGGKYGPTFAKYMEEQTDAIMQGDVTANNTVEIRVETLGLVNGIVDDLIQDYYGIQYAYNNSYGLQAISQLQQLNGLRDYRDSCVPAIGACRRAAALGDPDNDGDVRMVNSVCSSAQDVCLNLTAAFQQSGRNVYDIRVTDPSPEPDAAYREYLNNATVQQAIGARVNYTESNPNVQGAFIATGDSIRADPLYDLADLLRKGVRVALLYGDADWICNWLGGEAVSLALASILNTPTTTTTSSGTSRPVSGPTPPIVPGPAPFGTYASGFPAAGYADIVVNSSYVGGAVRQYGNLSFSRIYDAAHFVPYSQPETAFTVFSRIILGTDISTGNDDITEHSSTGPPTADHVNQPFPKQPLPTCWVRSIDSSCSLDDANAIARGEGFVRNGVWYKDEKDAQSGPDPADPAAADDDVTATTASGLAAPTGVFVATSTPSPKGQAVGLRPGGLGRRVGLGLGTVVALALGL